MLWLVDKDPEHKNLLIKNSVFQIGLLGQITPSGLFSHWCHTVILSCQILSLSLMGNSRSLGSMCDTTRSSEGNGHVDSGRNKGVKLYLKTDIHYYTAEMHFTG